MSTVLEGGSFFSGSVFFRTAVTSLVHRRASIPYSQARSCYCGLKWVCSVAIGGTLVPFRHFTYVTAHSPTLSSLYLSHSSFSNPFVALPTSQLILQPFRCFTYVTAHSPTLLSLLLRYRIFTYVTWRAAHGTKVILQERAVVGSVYVCLGDTGWCSITSSMSYATMNIIFTALV